MAFTSPPYWGQRDYGVDGQLGHEPSPREYADALVVVLRELRRVLAADGVVFLNLGDAYSSRSRRTYPTASAFRHGHDQHRELERVTGMHAPHKSLLGLPWLVALALRDDGWIIRAAITWQRLGFRPHPRAVDRPQSNAETIFLLARSEFYYYDPAGHPLGASSVWPIPVAVDDVDHPAAFAPELAEVGVLCGSRPGDVVLDPFCGVASTGVAALRHGREFVGVDLNADYIATASERLSAVTPSLIEGWA